MLSVIVVIVLAKMLEGSGQGICIVSGEQLNCQLQLITLNDVFRVDLILITEIIR